RHAPEVTAPRVRRIPFNCALLPCAGSHAVRPSPVAHGSLRVRLPAECRQPFQFVDLEQLLMLAAADDPGGIAVDAGIGTGEGDRPTLALRAAFHIRQAIGGAPEQGLLFAAGRTPGGAIELG